MASQITTFIENKPGALAILCRTFSDAGIDLRAMNVGDAMEFGIVRVIVRDSDKASRCLEEKGYVCFKEDVLAIEVPDRPGALVDLLDALSGSDINVDYTYALFVRKNDTAGFVIRTNDRDGAVKALSDAGIRLICDDEL